LFRAGPLPTRKAAASRRSPPKKIPLGNRPRLKKPQQNAATPPRYESCCQIDGGKNCAPGFFCEQRALAMLPTKTATTRNAQVRPCRACCVAVFFFVFFCAAGPSCHTAGEARLLKKNKAKPALKARLLHPAGLLRNFFGSAHRRAKTRARRWAMRVPRRHWAKPPEQSRGARPKNENAIHVPERDPFV
jgi:hypothetical protein